MVALGGQFRLFQNIIKIIIKAITVKSITPIAVPLLS